MRTVKEPDVRKQEILDGAIRVFAQKGYDKTTIADIARELNISQGLCYRYYPSKEEIYEAALEKYAELIAQENMRKTSLDLPVREMIDRLTSRMEYIKDAERGDQELYQLFHSGNCQRMHDELFLKVTRKVLPHVQAHLRKAKENGEIAIEDPDGAAIIGIYGWVGMCLTPGLTDEERMEKVRRAWYKLLEL